MNIGYIKKQALQLSPNLRKIVGNAGWLMVDRIVRMGLGVVVGVWIARYLGPAQFGSFNFAISYLALFTTLTTFGIDNIIIREIVFDASRAPELIGTGLALRLLGCTLTLPIIVTSIRYLQPNDHTAIFLVTLLSFSLIFQAFDTLDDYFQAHIRSKMTVWSKNFAFLLMSVTRVLLIMHHAALWTFAAVQVIEFAIGAGGMLFAYYSSGGHITVRRSSFRHALLLLEQSWPVILSGMAIMIYMRIDMVMLKMMQGDHATGIYAAATRVSEVWYFIPSAIVSSVSPAIMRVRSDQPLYYARIGKLFSVVTVIALVVGTVIALSSRWIVHALYSDAFGPAAPILAVHVWASVFVFLGSAQAPWDFAENLLRLAFYRTLCGAIANILLNLILIPRFSAMGAAIATVASYAVASVFANSVFPSTRRIFVMQMRSFLFIDLWANSRTPQGSIERSTQESKIG